MNYRTQTESWLASADLPSDLPRVLDEQGFWSMSGGSVVLTLAVPSEAEEDKACFFLYIPLLNTRGATDETLAAFYRELLQLQIGGALPSGLAFGMDDEDSLLVLSGKYPFRTMDAAFFNEILHSSCAVAAKLKEDLGNRLLVLAGEKKVTEALPHAAPVPALEELKTTPPRLNDNDLLRFQQFSFLQA